MAAQVRESIFPLVRAANQIVRTNRSVVPMRTTQGSYNNFIQFLGISTQNLKSIRFDQKKIKKIKALNISGNFGKPGNLLSALAGGALDAAGFVGDFFSRNRKVKPKSPGGKPVPKGPKVKFGGVRALGIANAVFAGLDFATGLAEGESVGKAAAGAGGALAGSLLGGAIGQGLIPIPGVGFMIGSALGGMAGGWLGDRAYEGGEKVASALSGREKLKQQEIKAKSKAAAVTPQQSFSDVLNQFESVVYKFERLSLGYSAVTSEGLGTAEGENYAPNSDPTEPQTPSGEDVSLDGEGTFIQGSTGKSTGPHFHIGPTELYDPVGDKWVNKKTEQGKKDAREAAFKIAKGFIAKKKYFRFTNAGIDVNPGSKVDDKTLRDYILREQNAHANRSGGGSWGGLDIAGEAGLRLPVPVGEVTWSVHGYGYAARIQGTNAFVGHGMKGSKKTPDKQVIKSAAPTAGQENFAPQPQSKEGPKQEVRPSQQELTKMSTDKLKSMLDPTVTAASNPTVFKAAQQARTKGQESGLSGEALERNVMIASIMAKNTPPPQVQPSQQQVVAPQQMQQLQQYPSYNIQRESVTLIPISQGSNSSPVTVSSAGGGGGMVIMPGPSSAQVLNSLFKTMLLTNLSST